MHALKTDDKGPRLRSIRQTATRCIETVFLANIFLIIVASAVYNSIHDRFPKGIVLTVHLTPIGLSTFTQGVVHDSEVRAKHMLPTAYQHS